MPKHNPLLKNATHEALEFQLSPFNIQYSEYNEFPKILKIFLDDFLKTILLKIQTPVDGTSIVQYQVTQIGDNFILNVPEMIEAFYGPLSTNVYYKDDVYTINMRISTSDGSVVYDSLYGQTAKLVYANFNSITNGNQGTHVDVQRCSAHAWGSDRRNGNGNPQSEDLADFDNFTYLHYTFAFPGLLINTVPLAGDVYNGTGPPTLVPLANVIPAAPEIAVLYFIDFYIQVDQVNGQAMDNTAIAAAQAARVSA